MSVSADLAFNARLWAYDPGRNGREEELVVKIRNSDGAAHSTPAKATLEIDDQTDAGKQWSPEELQVANVYRSELVVVVGELLPDDFPEREHLKTPSRGLPFDPHDHTIVKTNANSSVIVRRIGDEKCNIHLLHDKEDGLCRISQLPRTVENRIVYYREWVSKEYDARQKARTSKWRQNINLFCAQYLADHEDDFLDAEQAPPQNEKTAAGWQDGIIRNMIEGSDKFSLTDAAEAAKACQASTMRYEV
ncbi:hypothetical protein QQZ08_011347 [Neonectria magnoliae]|uniref:Uncharacterized protein n=1 Tax=Neonectria magnoliae TaxID=2732573 RepID=A0ABR1HAM9_9HYPO